MTTPNTVPQQLQNIIGMYKMAPKSMRLELLLEHSKKVPDLPEHLKNSDNLERVEECQTPFFLTTEFDESNNVSLFFDAPEEAPTTRGFAGILFEGVNGLQAQEILDLPNDFYMDMKLAELISPLRLRGMDGILFRLKRQIKDHISER